MNSVVKFGNSNLPSVMALSASLRAMVVDVGPSGGGGVALLKMDRTGHWVFGADATEVESEALWAVNPFSFTHGYIAWGEGIVLGETMVSVQQPLPEREPAPTGASKGWEVQIGMSLNCLSGADKGIDVRYSATSVGGKRSLDTLAKAIADRTDVNPGKPVPVVKLGKAHYQHKAYGRIFTPVFEIVDWVDLNGESDAPAAADEAPAPAPAGRRRRSV